MIVALSVPEPAAQLAEQSSAHFTGNSPSRRLTFRGVQENPFLGPVRLRTRPRLGISLPSFMPSREDHYTVQALPRCNHGREGGQRCLDPSTSSRCEPPTHTSLSLCRACPQMAGGGVREIGKWIPTSALDPPWGCRPGGQGQAPTRFRVPRDQFWGSCRGRPT